MVNAAYHTRSISGWNHTVYPCFLFRKTKLLMFETYRMTTDCNDTEHSPRSLVKSKVCGVNLKWQLCEVNRPANRTRRLVEQLK